MRVYVENTTLGGEPIQSIALIPDNVEEAGVLSVMANAAADRCEFADDNFNEDDAGNVHVPVRVLVLDGDTQAALKKTFADKVAAVKAAGENAGNQPPV